MILTWTGRVGRKADMNKEAIKYTRQREEMVKHQIESRGITDPKVLQKFIGPNFLKADIKESEV